MTNQHTAHEKQRICPEEELLDGRGRAEASNSPPPPPPPAPDEVGKLPWSPPTIRVMDVRPTTGSGVHHPINVETNYGFVPS